MPPLARLPQFDEVLEEVLRREAETRAAFQAADGARILPAAVAVWA